MLLRSLTFFFLAAIFLTFPAYSRVLHPERVFLKKGYDDSNCYLPLPVIQDTFRELHTGSPFKIDLVARYSIYRMIYEIPEENFTVILLFSLDKEFLQNVFNPAIYIPDIHKISSIYMNGNLIYTEKSMTGKFQEMILPLYLSSLQEGMNVVCYHLREDRYFQDNIFLLKGLPKIGNLQKLYNHFHEFFLITFITVFTMIGLFHFVLFVNNLNKLYYLYFGIFSLNAAFYLFLNNLSLEKFFYIPQEIQFYKLELISLFSFIPIFVKFQESLLNLKHRFWQFRFLILYSLIFIMLVLMAPSKILDSILFFWYVISFFALLILSKINLQLFIKKWNISKKNTTLPQKIYKSILMSVQGNVLLGVIAVLLAAIVDILILVFQNTISNVTKITVLLILIASTLRFIFNIFLLARHTKHLNRKLKASFYKLKSMYNKIKLSQKKYRYLFHNTSDIFIITDSKGKIKSLSNSFETILQLKKKDYLNKHFISLIYTKEGRVEAEKVLYNKIMQFYSNGVSLSLQIPLITFGDIPFQYFDVKFEKLNIDDPDPEIFIRASLLNENPVARFLAKEYAKYIFHTDLFIIDNIITKLTEEVAEHLTPMELSMIRIGLREILINAIEHGNLEITSEEKKFYLKQGDYYQFIKQRIEDPYYKNRKIVVEYQFNGNKVIYRVTDEGKGFDVAKYLQNLNVFSDDLHGRGIFITRHAFDKVMYNKKGNSVTLVKNLQNITAEN